MELDETVNLGLLLDIYGSLLTKKKYDILSMYVFDNMSFKEIADCLDISKPAVLDSIRVAEEKLYNLEENLGVLKFRQKLQKLAQSSENLKEDLLSLLKE